MGEDQDIDFDIDEAAQELEEQQIVDEGGFGVGVDENQNYNYYDSSEVTDTDEVPPPTMDFSSDFVRSGDSGSDSYTSLSSQTDEVIGQNSNANGNEISSSGDSGGGVAAPSHGKAAQREDQIENFDNDAEDFNNAAADTGKDAQNAGADAQKDAEQKQADAKKQTKEATPVINWKPGMPITMALMEKIWSKCRNLNGKIGAKLKPLIERANDVVRQFLATVGPNPMIALHNYIDKVADTDTDTIGSLLKLAISNGKRNLYTSLSAVEAFFDQNWMQVTILAALTPVFMDTVFQTPLVHPILTAIFTIAVPVLNAVDKVQELKSKHDAKKAAKAAKE